MSRLLVCAILALGLAAGAGAKGVDDKDIRLAGCLVRGENGDGYLLTNIPGEAAWQQSSSATVVPGPVGTTGTIATIFYWLDDREGLDEHVGHHIEIEGRLNGDLKDGDITVKREARWSEIEVRSDGRSLKARVSPSLLVVPSRGSADDARIGVLVRKVEARRVRMLAAVCGR